MDRRDFFQIIAALALPPLCTGSLNAQRASNRAAQRRFIDVHCHFFNASDLPVRGFIQQVVLGDYAELRTLPVGRTLLPTAERLWKGLASLLVKTVLNARAPGPRDEMQCLSDLATCPIFARFAGSVQPEPAGDKVRSANTPGSLLRFTLQDHFAALENSEAASARTIADDADIDAFIGFVLDEMKSKARVSRDVNTLALRRNGAVQPKLLLDIADFITGGDSIFSRYFRWAHLLTSYRSEIIAKYISLYQTAKRRLTIATPALVDYSYWLDDQSPADLREQTKLMGLLSLRQPVPIHGFTPFDPARNVRREEGQPSSLAIVQEAISQHGFIGVKLYSPMGFSPSGNANERVYPPRTSRDDAAFGHKLDEELFALYDWCAREDVPILAHTTDSQSANKGFAGRADPKFWIAVLEKYNGLKVNLAHFGNFKQARTQRGFDVSLYTTTWESRIGEIIRDQRFSQVFADISYFGWVLGNHASEATTIMAIKKLLAQYLLADPKAERLLFGTDWSMTAREDGFEAYLDNVEAFFRDVGLNDAAIDNLFYGNAIRFLGLQPGAKTHSRLTEFYGRHGKTIPSFT